MRAGGDPVDCGAVTDPLTLLPRTRAAFLLWEESQKTLHEFVDGAVRPLPERPLVHGVIANNMHATLYAQLNYFGWVVFHAGARVAVGGDIFHPDISVTRDSDALAGDCIEQPVLIAEITPTTEMYDRGLKRRRCQELLPSLQTYMLIADDAVEVELFCRGENFWRYSAHTQPDDAIDVGYPRVRLTIAEIYDRVLERLLDKQR